MKTKSKALILALCAVLLVTASVFGTMAYLTDNKKVTNTFTVGSVAITLDEAKVDTDGKPVENANRVTDNTYKLLPGHEYTKDPTIHVDANSEDCFLFVKVENGIAGIEAANDNVASQMAKNGWKLVTDQTNVYVYVGKTAGATEPLAVEDGEDFKVFEKIAIAGDTVDSNKLNEYKTAKITVTAYAVQKDGFEDKTDAQIWKTAFANA